MALGGDIQRLSQEAGGQLSHAVPRARGAERLHERGQADGGASLLGEEGAHVGLILLLVFLLVLVTLSDEVRERNESVDEEDDDEV